MNFSSIPAIRKLVLLFLIIGGLYFARTLLIPLAVAALLAALFLPFCMWLERIGLHRVLAALLCVCVLLIAIGGVLTVIGWQISELSQDFSTIRQRISEALSNAQNFITSQLGITATRQEKIIQDQQFNYGSALSSATGSLASVFTGFIMMLVYIILILYYRAHLKKFALMLAPAGQKNEVATVIENAANVSHQYLFGLVKMIVCLWIMYGIGFAIIGVKSFLFFAVLCGVLEIVPFVGNITGTTITVLVSAVQGASPAMLGGIILTYSFVQFIQGWVLEPVIVGPQVKINAFATVVSLVAGNLIWGIPGVMLAIPLTGMLKIVCDHVEPLKPYGFLIGEIKNEKPGKFQRIWDRMKKKLKR